MNVTALSNGSSAGPSQAALTRTGPLPLSDIIVGIIDDGLSLDHALYAQALDGDLSMDHADGDASDLMGNDTGHGTAVAGVIAGDGAGVDGVAPGVTLAGHRISYDGGPLSMFTAAFNAQLNADVVNNSWQFVNPFFANNHEAYFQPISNALNALASEGRDGLGTSVVFAAGNDAANGDNVNYHNLQNAQSVITVGAVDGAGRAADFSNPGAAVLVSALGVGVETTDVEGSAGYAGGDTAFMNGTSFAAPVVTGTIARMYAANPTLGYRDVQEILAYTARPTDSADAGWQTNGANNWNGGGLNFHHHIGFGVVDTEAAVRLAQSWSGSAHAHNAVRASFTDYTGGASIPDGPSSGPLRLYFTVDEDILIDRVVLDIDITHAYRNDLSVTLVSPDGTESVLIDRPNDDEADIRFETSSVAHMGENAQGVWEVRVEDHAGHDIGSVSDLTLSFTGDSDNADDLYVYTDAFGEVGGGGRSVLSDMAGEDTLNLAALSDGAQVYLDTGSAVIAGRSLEIADNTTIEAVHGGGGNDLIRGGLGSEALDGGHGDDVLNGRAGADVLAGNVGSDHLFGGAGEDVAVFGGRVADFVIDALDAVTLRVRDVRDDLVDFGTDQLRDIEWLSFTNALFSADTFLPGSSPSSGAPAAAMQTALSPPDADDPVIISIPSDDGLFA